MTEHQRAGLRAVWRLVGVPVAGIVLFVPLMALVIVYHHNWGFVILVCVVSAIPVVLLARDVYRDAVKDAERRAKD